MTESSSGRPVGLLLVNLGTPDAPDAASVRRYLREFLSDPRVVELPRALWLPALYGIILNTRPKRSAKAYAAIWEPGAADGPIKAITRAQAALLGARAAGWNLSAPVIVDFAMRYGAPSIRDRIEALIEQGCERISVLPLYPQYAASTTATAADEVFRTLAKMRHQPALRIAAPYYDHPAYISALARSMTEELNKLDFEPEVILASFHGLPKAQIELGDPYKAHCETTFRLLGDALGLGPERFRLSFQSRFGPTEWIKPYTSETVAELAKSGVKRLAIVAPGFAADCLETLEELGVEIRDVFLAAGGEKYARLPCLNDSAPGMELLETLARSSLAGWAD